MPSGVDLAAANDFAGTDHIFYEKDRQQLVQAMFYGSVVSENRVIATIPHGSKFTAAYDLPVSNNFVTVYYRNASDSSTISYEVVNENGGKVLSSAIT